MKAYKVRYDVGSRIALTEVLIVKDESYLESALESKSLKGFRAGDKHSKITYKWEISFSQVKVGDLSVDELNLLEDRKKETTELDYNDVYQFMKDFKVDILNSYDELVIDQKTNVYTSLKGCTSIEDVEFRAVLVVCRPIGKGLSIQDGDRLLVRVNDYFDTDLTRKDMLLLYEKYGNKEKEKELKDFIKRGLPKEELRGG